MSRHLCASPLPSFAGVTCRLPWAGCFLPFFPVPSEGVPSLIFSISVDSKPRVQISRAQGPRRGVHSRLLGALEALIRKETANDSVSGLWPLALFMALLLPHGAKEGASPPSLRGQGQLGAPAAGQGLALAMPGEAPWQLLLD